jgi:membrane protein
VITLGGFIAVTTLAVYSAGQYVQIFEGLPLGAHILRLVAWLAPLLAYLLIVGLLAGFYRYIPNTQVYFYPALSGAFIVSLLLILNKKLSVFYVTYVVNQQSLYGSLGIVPIMMLALFVFWVFILIGGQITYAIQNANYLANQQAWQNTSHSTREILSLAALILIARRFKACHKAYSATELSRRLRVPGQILNESLSKLTEMGFITLTTSESEKSGVTKRFQPAKPLSNIDLFQFKQSLDNYGNSEGKELLLSVDPLMSEFSQKAESNFQNDWQHHSLEELLETDQS